MKNSIGLGKRGYIGVTNSEGRLVCFDDYRPVKHTIRGDDVDSGGWITTPLETLLIPGEFL